MRLAVLQELAVVNDLEANLATVVDGMRAAADRGADVLVTPELFLTGYAPLAVRAAADPQAIAGVLERVVHARAVRHVLAHVVHADIHQLRRVQRGTAQLRRGGGTRGGRQPRPAAREEALSRSARHTLTNSVTSQRPCMCSSRIATARCRRAARTTTACPASPPR